MAVREVTIYGNPILRRRCAPVTDFSALAPIIADMLDTMYEEEGVGLAANQIGLDMHLLVVDVSHTGATTGPEFYVNGEIIVSEGEATQEEGCLSLPDIRCEVKRAAKITLKYQDIAGVEHVGEFEGLQARAIQHEIDHLNGILIVDRGGPLVKMKFSKALKELEQRAKQQIAS